MSNTLRIELADQEGALMRLVGLVERRGFSIATLDKAAARDGRAIVTLQVAAREGARQIDVLVRQIGRLFDVNSVMEPEMAPELVPVSAHRGSTPCRPRM